MIIRVKLFASLGRLAGSPFPGTPLEVQLSEPATLADLVRVLQLPAEEVKICFVNGRVEEEDFKLSPGDEVGIFPPIGGG